MNSPAATPAPALAPRTQLPAPGVALGLFTESFAHRAELAAVELGEAREHAFVSSLLAGATAALVLFTGFALTLLVAGLVWDNPHRGWWLGSLCLAYLAGTVATGFILAHRLQTWRPLAETHFQLNQDYQCLSQLIKSTAS